MPRKFGVEIECGYPGDVEDVQELLEDAHDAGKIGPWYDSVGEDGTCAEVRVGPVSGVAGLNEVCAVMDLIRNNGGYVTGSDGLHVHFDAPEFYNDNPRVYSRYTPNDQSDVLIESWFNNQALIRNLVAAHRHDHWACVGWSPAQVEHFKKSKATSRHEIHMAIQHRTIEVRLLQGTLDTALATSWVRFGLAFVNSMVDRPEPLPTQPDVGELMKVIRTPVVARRVLTSYDKSEYADEGDDDEW